MTRLIRLRIGVLVLTAVAAVGCQPAPMTSSLPSPRFSGPTIQSAPPVQPAIPKKPPYVASNWSPKYMPGVPNDWIPHSQPRQWKYIVIHHSASAAGNIAIIDREHKEKGWDGIGYHWVVGNGRGMGDGEIEPTPRWPIQKWGAHTKTPDNRFNDFGIGICMVGNFDLSRPSQTQVRSVAKLVAYLMKTYNISPSNVYGHGQCKPTNCPGKYNSVPQIKQMAMQYLADAGIKTPASTDVAAEMSPETELMH